MSVMEEGELPAGLTADACMCGWLCEVQACMKAPCGCMLCGWDEQHVC